MKIRQWVPLAVVLMVVAPLTLVSTAQAASTVSSSESMNLAAGQLSVGSVVNGSLSGVVNSSIQGTYPQATWSDTTGSGAGWQGSIAVSSAVYTGSWTPQGSATALASTSAGSYTGTGDGLQITVSVGSGATSTSTPFTWADNSGGSGSGTATNGTPVAVEDGVTINFASGTTYTSGAQYMVDAGAQSSSALELLSSAASVAAATGTASPSPTLVNSTATVSAGGAAVYGASVPFVSAAIDTGMGSYTVAPGVDVIVDTSSWAATYTAQAQYTIASGPGSAPTTAGSSATTTASYDSAILADSPVHFWPFAETSGTTANDLGSDPVLGTYSNVTLAQPSVLPNGTGTSAGFNGSSSEVVMGTAAAITGTGNYSAEAWVCPSSVSAIQVVIGQRDASSISGEWALELAAGGYPQFFEYNGSSYDFNFSSPTALSVGSCYLLDALRSSGVAYLYVNGVLVASAAAAMGNLSALTVAVGVDYRNQALGYPASFFSGRIADVALYTSGLSASEIAAHYAAGGG